jgi:hypothetical protein
MAAFLLVALCASNVCVAFACLSSSTTAWRWWAVHAALHRHATHPCQGPHSAQMLLLAPGDSEVRPRAHPALLMQQPVLLCAWQHFWGAACCVRTAGWPCAPAVWCFTSPCTAEEHLIDDRAVPDGGVHV